MRRFIALALLCIPSALVAQQGDNTVSPGMTRAQVVAALGAPATQRSANGFTYLFYQNSCGRACGMQDLVIMKGDSLTDAIFRSPNRHFTGTSSSPEEMPPALTSRAARPAAKPMTIRKDEAPSAQPTPAAPSQLKPPAKPSDATPSIPLDEKKLEPLPPTGAAPATSPPTQNTPG